VNLGIIGYVRVAFLYILPHFLSRVNIHNACMQPEADHDQNPWSDHGVYHLPHVKFYWVPFLFDIGFLYASFYKVEFVFQLEGILNCLFPQVIIFSVEFGGCYDRPRSIKRMEIVLQLVCNYEFLGCFLILIFLTILARLLGVLHCKFCVFACCFFRLIMIAWLRLALIPWQNQRTIEEFRHASRW